MTVVVTRVLVRTYQYTLGLVLPDSCRFQPTCSEYAIQAVEMHGICGLWLALRRVARCHPWGGYGQDPVPSVGVKVGSRKEERRMHSDRASELTTESK